MNYEPLIVIISHIFSNLSEEETNLNLKTRLMDAKDYRRRLNHIPMKMSLACGDKLCRMHGIFLHPNSY
jgi:hypothetical protein